MASKDGKVPNSQQKLSSGIMGMKFMQKDEPSMTSEPLTPANTDEDMTSKVKFQHEKDPGEWFSQESNQIKRNTLKSESVGFSEIYRIESTAQGRRSYGSPVNIVNPEEMADGYTSENKNKKKKNPKGQSKETGSKSGNFINRKRLSESENENPGKRRATKSR